MRRKVKVFDATERKKKKDPQLKKERHTLS